MHIFVDESGTFTNSDQIDSWCVVAGYVSPESNRVAIQKLIFRLRLECANGAETKLKHITEERFLKFLKELRNLKGVAFAVAVDVGLHKVATVAHHRDVQAKKVVEHKNKMLHESGKSALEDLSNAIHSLPVQLYTQLFCQVELFHKILTRAPLYYVQRHPQTLGHLRWRIDRKDKIPTAYEDAFRILLPVLLQTMAINDPMIMLKGADYSHFKRFDFAAGEEPTYLKTDYGIDSNEGSNIGMMIREDFQLVDSALVPGVQIADLLASGLRRLLRGEFKQSDEVAKLLGANMIQELRNESPVRLVSLDQSGNVSQRTSSLIKLMASHSRSMLTR